MILTCMRVYLVPAHMRGYYDYVELFNGVRTNVPKHLRGCVCQLKRCVKFCCSSGIPLFRPTKKAPVECDVDKKEYSPLVNITLPDSSRVVMNVLDKFVVQQGIPCGDGYMLLPHLYEEDQWELYENGTIVRKLDNLPRSRRDYCLTVFNSPLATKFELFPLYCDKVDAFGTIKISTTCMMISAPFLYLTILIYWVVPKLWNLHSKCLICYLLSLAIGTTLIVVINMSTSEYPIAVCATMGFFAYYFLLAVFFWLNVICFDLWQIFRGNISNIGHMSEAQRFRYYSLYAWGLPAVMTVITVGLQYSNLPAELQSGIGDTHCWLNTEEWSAMLYFYGPCLILILSNIAMFYSTVRRIYNIRREVQKLTQDDYTLRRMRGHQNK
ncbi:unnamed protein product [Ceratitis capitata]|uniref:(Mediterranean fruit fly) hypothetical protein n=1 Tax=Ceratitis capitata TaxID=7213 RepID=A0A811UVG8_CERCA|nr:unnamed protein product [Ceratitis capitata]